MKYVQWHLGDWISSTMDLSPTERGVYFDLLMRYYQTETPVIRSYFERITRGYTDAERSAFDYVIDRFFTEAEDGTLHNARADKEIAAFKEKSEKARRSVNARWKKRDTVESANEERTKYERIGNVLLTNNHKPITNKYKETTLTGGKENPDAIADATAPALDAVSVPETKKAEKRKSPATRCPFASTDSIPEDFEAMAVGLGVESPQRVFSRFVAHAEANDRKAVRWKAAFRMWCLKEIEFNPPKKTLEQEQEEQKKRVLAQIEAEGF